MLVKNGRNIIERILCNRAGKWAGPPLCWRTYRYCTPNGTNWADLCISWPLNGHNATTVCVWIRVCLWVCVCVCVHALRLIVESPHLHRIGGVGQQWVLDPHHVLILGWTCSFPGEGGGRRRHFTGMDCSWFTSEELPHKDVISHSSSINILWPVRPVMLHNT